MDLVIKIENAEKLRYFQEKMGAKQLVIDAEKVIKDSEEFNKIFEKSCEKYVEAGESYLVPNEDIKEAMETTTPCENCKYYSLRLDQEPCRSCFDSAEYNPNWEAKSNTPKIKSLDVCKTCKYWTLTFADDPCRWCYLLDHLDHYEPEEPTLKEATEHMQSEFDATGKDVRYFMENKNIKHEKEGKK